MPIRLELRKGQYMAFRYDDCRLLSTDGVSEISIRDPYISYYPFLRRNALWVEGEEIPFPDMIPMGRARVEKERWVFTDPKLFELARVGGKCIHVPLFDRAVVVGIITGSGKHELIYGREI